MQEELSRTALLLGEDAVQRLAQNRVAVFGVGGVGGYAVEALARSGVGALDLIDSDTVAPGNINRQIIALHSTIGQYKVDAAAARVADIRPETTVRVYRLFYTPDTAGQFDFADYDYIIDAVDTVTAKIDLIVRAVETGTPIISAMGAGNKLDPSLFRVADIAKTSMCPLAKVMRRELGRRGIRHTKVVFSPEPPLTPMQNGDAEQPAPGRRQIPGSVAFVPSVAGLILAGEVILDLTHRDRLSEQK